MAMCKNSIGPFVAKIDPKTLETKWYTQLRNTVDAKEWDYPGAMAIESDGFIYVVSGYYLYKVHPEDGHVIDTLPLPTMVYMRNNYPTLPADLRQLPHGRLSQHILQRHQRAAGRHDRREVVVPGGGLRSERWRRAAKVPE